MTKFYQTAIACAADSTGTVTLSIDTSDDEGLMQYDTAEVEVEVPGNGVIRIQAESENMEMMDNEI